MKKIYLDTETTSLEPGQICQISYLVEEDSQLIKRVNQYYKVDFVDYGASKVTGLTVDNLEYLSGGTQFKDRADEMLKDFEDSIIIGHNISFDIRFLTEEFRRLGIYYIPNSVFDTMNYFKDILKLPKRGRYKGYKYPKLDEVLEFTSTTKNEVTRFASAVYGNYPMQAHDSRFDAMAVYIVCKKMEKVGMLDIVSNVSGDILI